MPRMPRPPKSWRTGLRRAATRADPVPDLSRAPLALTLALRYLKSSRKDSFVSFLSTLAGGGLAVGVAALILALAALGGFQNALREEVMARTPEIAVSTETRRQAEAVLARLSPDPRIAAAHLTREGSGWIAFEGSVRAVDLVGFAGELPPIFPPAGEAGPASRASGVYLPQGLADTWGVGVGDALELASSRPTLTPLGPQPRTVRARVAGTFSDGVTQQSLRVALPLSLADALLGPGRYRILLDVDGLEEAAALASKLPSELASEPASPAPLAPGMPAASAAEGEAGIEVQSWQDLNRPLFFALKLERTLIFCAVFLIVAVAALALVSNVHLIVAAKRREIGILGAMGARSRLVRSVFVILGSILGAAGVALGAVAGVVLAGILGRYRVIRLPADVYFLDHVPFQLEAADVGAVVLASLAAAVTAALLAARAAAALRPVEALHQ